MRDLKNMIQIRRRTRRRALFALLLISSGSSTAVCSIATADEPVKTQMTLQLLPSLPLIESPSQKGPEIQQTAHDVVKANPFCDPEVVAPLDPSIQLASGDDAPAVRLKPIGAAIGLQPIGSPKIVRPSGSAITIEPMPAPAIKSNPLIESKLHKNEELVDAKVEPSPEKPDTKSNVITQPNVMEKATVKVVESEAESEPVYFSFSDEIEIDTPIDTPKNDPVPTPSDLAKDTIEEDSLDVEQLEQVEDESIELIPHSPQLEQLMAGDVATEEALPMPTSMAMTKTSETKRKMVTVREAKSMDETENDSDLGSRRYRAPVAVEAPPVSYERTEMASASSAIDSKVMSASAPTLAGVSPLESNQLGSDDLPVSLYMTRAQVRSLSISGELRRVVIEDQNVVRAMASSSSEIKLIAAGCGVTRLVVWATGDDGAPSLVRQFDVHVQDAVEATGDSVGNKAEMLTRTIKKSFPESKVSVKTVDDHLVISGSCSSEETATKILRMVRKTCLIPVRDELVVH